MSRMLGVGALCPGLQVRPAAAVISPDGFEARTPPPVVGGSRRDRGVAGRRRDDHREARGGGGRRGEQEEAGYEADSDRM